MLTPEQLAVLAERDYPAEVSPPSFDKQFIRDYLETTTWDKASPPPKLPDEVVSKSAAKYQEAAGAIDALEGKILPQGA